MSKHRNPQARLSKQPSPDNADPSARTFDVSGALDILREIIGRTEALVTATEDALERDPWDADDADHGRRVEHLAHLLASAKEAAHAARDAGSQMAAGLAMHRAVNA
jgi:hypothetical protein